MSSDRLLNTMIYVMNKALYNIAGDTSRSISRISSKYLMDYLLSQKITQLKESEVSSQELKKIAIEELGLCDDYQFYEDENYAILEITNPVIKESVIQLNKENIPIVLTPDMVFMYMICKINNCKAIYEKVDYDEENNKTLWKFKKY